MKVISLISVLRILMLALLIIAGSIFCMHYISTNPAKSLEKLQQFTDDFRAELKAKLNDPTAESPKLRHPFAGYHLIQNGQLSTWKEVELIWLRQPFSFVEMTESAGQANQVFGKFAFYDMRDSCLSLQLLEAAGSRHIFEVSTVATNFIFSPNPESGEVTYLRPKSKLVPTRAMLGFEQSLMWAFIVFFLYNFCTSKISGLIPGLIKPILTGVSAFLGFAAILLFVQTDGFENFARVDFSPFILTGGFWLFLSSCQINRFKFPGTAIKRPIIKFLAQTGRYMLFSMLILAAIRFIIWHTTYVNSNFELDQLFTASAESMGQFGGMLLFILALFIFHHKIYQGIYEQSPGFAERVKWFSTSLLIIIPLVYYTGTAINPWLVMMGIFAYVMLFDLFTDTARMSISWVIWWMIVISSFISILMFYSINQRQKMEIAQGLDQLAQEPDTLLSMRIAQSFTPGLRDSVYSVLVTNDSERSFIELPNAFRSYANNLKRKLEVDDIRFYWIESDGKTAAFIQAWEFDRLIRNLNLSHTLSNGVLYSFLENMYFVPLNFDPDRFSQNMGILYVGITPKNSAIHDTETDIATDVLPFAVYDNGILIYTNGSGFPEEAPEFPATDTEFDVNGEKWLAHPLAGEGFIASKYVFADILKPVSLFSYLFFLFGILLILFTLLNQYIPLFPGDFNFTFSQLSLRNKIQISVVALIVFAFIIIGIVSIYYFSRLSSGYSNQSLIQTATRINNQLKLDDPEIHNDGNIESFVSEQLFTLGKVQQADLILYDQSGKIFNSTIRLNQQAMDAYLQRKAYENILTDQGQIYFLTQILADKGKKIRSAVIGFSFDETSPPIYIQAIDRAESSFSSNISGLIGTLLNVYVFLFLIAGAIALAVANSITYPIAVLGEKLRKFKLGKQNEPLEWSSKDELGALISEYNQLINKLDESAQMIAKTERDIAWREMAKQVAHEIKNPLTPMKLSIQYLEKAIHRNPEESEKLIDRVSETLIEQIDNLTQIANEFSNFAKLPQAQNDKIVLNDVVETVHDLFRKREDMDIVLQVPIDDVIVFADKNHLIRILNNLVKNAIQAIPNDRRGKIDLELFKEDDTAVIKVSDNGIGIPETMKDKVFSPNFTTKSSGTGLGLAISANMIDSFNGNIFFDSNEGKGSQFYITIPLMKLEDNFKEENRVFLDE